MSSLKTDFFFGSKLVYHKEVFIIGFTLEESLASEGSLVVGWSERAGTRALKLLCGCDTKFTATALINNHLLCTASCSRPSAGSGISGDNTFGIQSSYFLPKGKKIVRNALGFSSQRV